MQSGLWRLLYNVWKVADILLAMYMVIPFEFIIGFSFATVFEVVMSKFLYEKLIFFFYLWCYFKAFICYFKVSSFVSI